ncbi:MAG: dihydroxyacetone kinase subunit DhaK [Spirochaetes bacterium]|nr:MAG: dihydroxyacetone kinase subunit DhaK [Spirochaetota bacterium]
MKKFINDPEKVVDEMVEGFAAANSNKVRLLKEARVIARVDAPVKGKVGVVTGGGSGHKPAFIGYTGKGMVDAVAVGEIFTSPPADAFYHAFRVANGGRGVACLYGNYAGDVMNVDMASEMAEADGIEVKQVIANDDVPSAPKGREENRRGVAGEILMWKIGGAMAERGESLDEVIRVAQKAIDNTRSMGVGLSPCIIPAVGKPNFQLGENEMEVGIGHHGEPGIKKMEIKSADEIAEMAMDIILPDLPFEEGNEVCVLISGLGSTPLMELYILYRKVNEILNKKNICVYRSYVGNFFTSLEMAGATFTVMKLDEELKELLDAPADAVHFVQT